ncbi:MAG TPA: zinc-binding dehydrogenase [Candidatus Binatia bacterium]|jgi:NADPH2:quinone reductase|nr:zinc-binding dehydrogenase [Candidatus Binatia bacterium]
MKAMRAHQFGGPEQLRFEDAPDPQAQAGQVQIRVRAAGINPADLVRLSGRLQPLTLPYIPGTDVCGEVDAVGAGVTHVKKGDRVFGRAVTGGYAEKTCLAASEAIPLPANLSFAEGAAIPIPFYTAYHALHHKAALKPSETVLISAGGGGVGVAAIQLAKLAGARVITTVGSAEKAARTRELGADVALNYKEQDFAAEVQKLTDGKGVDVIIENVAADNLAKDLPILARDGRIILIGTGTGKGPDGHFAVMYALMKDANLLGMSLVNAGPVIPEMATTLSSLFAAGKLKAIVSKTYPLPEAQQALADLVAGRVFGKLALTP